jgi:hypothetical protein
MVAADGKAFARAGETWLEWTFDGWQHASLPAADARLLTPPATISALAQGYAPIWHPSAHPIMP